MKIPNVGRKLLFTIANGCIFLAIKKDIQDKVSFPMILKYSSRIVVFKLKVISVQRF